MKKVRIFLLLSSLLLAATSVAQVVDLRGRWKFHVGDEASWASASFDDTKWESIRVPAAWEDEGFNGYDGFAWYRVRFDGRKLQKDNVYYLNLGFVDDADEAFLNEKLIGFSGACPPKFKTAYNTERKYILPASYINFDGENIIAVRVFDGVHRGGIVDGSIGIYNVNDGAKLLVDLQGIWSFQKSRNGERIKNSEAWQNIMVPGAWEHQGLARYDGFGWYRREFKVSANFTKDPVVLMLGKIDDFDKVYINGTLIGSTNDRRPYGLSESYTKTRVYNIPKELLKWNATNVIEILVEDIGNIGGIYEGIIGITTKTNYERHFNR